MDRIRHKTCTECLKLQMILGVQISLTRTGSRGHHHRDGRATEPESTIVVDTGANEEKKVITDLRPYSHYTLAVAVFNSKGEGPPSETLSFMTEEGGEKENEREKLGTEGERGTTQKWREVIDKVGEEV